jgi:site-specific DNA-methyltransferase (adenine-specific)/modification methylase
MTDRITDRIEIVNADCYTLLDAWPSDAALVTDPPYGIAHRHSGISHGPKWQRCNTKPVHGDDAPFDPAPFCRFGLVLLWGADHFRARLPEGGTFLAWNKAGEKDFNDSFSDAEFAWTNAKVRRNVCNVMWKGICGMNGDERKRWHPTQKPIELCAWCLTVLKVDADALVIDPFMGSGSLGVACHRAGLRYLGVEIDPEHYATAKARLQRETAQGLLCMPNSAITSTHSEQGRSDPAQMAVDLPPSL